MNNSLVYLIFVIAWGIPSTEVNSSIISSNHIIMQPLDHQRRIGSLPPKMLEHSEEKSQMTENKKDTSALIFNNRRFIHSSYRVKVKQENTALNPMATVNNTPEAYSNSENKAIPNPDKWAQYLIKIFDDYGIFGGIIALFILFSGIRYCLKF